MRRTSEDLKHALTSASLDRHQPEKALEEIGRLLLKFTTTKKAIIINRAAVADVSETGQLAAAIEKHARAPIVARLVDIMLRFEFSESGMQDTRALKAAGTFVGLLMGEVQIQQALGAVPPLSESEIDMRASDAVTALMILFPPTRRPTRRIKRSPI
ncbi:MAG: TetR/AcrR family transcriptional regulator C-terminal domain-containing protein [Pseudomonadota bacterium]